jgi:hypothetical protein
MRRYLLSLNAILAKLLLSAKNNASYLENDHMIDTKTVQEIQEAPVEERIQVIEQILQSLKKDIQKTSSVKTFIVRKFNLGAEVTVDRDQLYAERTV